MDAVQQTGRVAVASRRRIYVLPASAADAADVIRLYERRCTAA